MGILVSFFAAVLIIIIGLVVQLSYSEQDTILDAHEFYYYSQMVQSWGAPPDTNKVLFDLKNLQLQGAIFSIENNDSSIYWKYPSSFISSDYFSYSDSEILGEFYNVKIPLYVSFGDMNNIVTTYVENENFRYFLALNRIEPSAFQIKFIPASLITILFCAILFLFIKNYLQPIRLIRLRVMELEKGNLDSKIDVIRNDELGYLTRIINKMIRNIKSLLNQKQQLLSEVSHELMSPLTRMQLLVELTPDHKNKYKIKNEIVGLRNIISNLLLSDKLDIPYSNLNLEKTNFSHFLDKIIAKYPDSSNRIVVKNSFPKINLNIDALKINIAIKNIIDNAFKYSSKNSDVIIFSYVKQKHVIVSINNQGNIISAKDIEKIKNPFVRVNKDSSIQGFGLGLAIANKIVLAHNGKLEIVSNINAGTTFSFYFPIN